MGADMFYQWGRKFMGQLRKQPSRAPSFLWMNHESINASANVAKIGRSVTVVVNGSTMDLLEGAKK